MRLLKINKIIIIIKVYNFLKRTVNHIYYCLFKLIFNVNKDNKKFGN